MQFMSHKKRRAPTVIIISLIDVLMVVLIFLVVSTTFKQQPAFKLVLPESKTAKPGASESAPLVITIDKKEPYFYLANRAVTYEQLRTELKTRAAKNPDVAVAIRPSEEAPVGQFYKVLDAVNEAKIKRLDAWSATPKAPSK
jgi:biopolymer transport protein ExbD